MSDADERAAERREDWATLAKLRHRRGACPWCGGAAGKAVDVADVGPGEHPPNVVACCCMTCFTIHHNSHKLPDERVACIGCPGVTT